MFAEISTSPISAPTMLWLAVAAIAGFLFFSAINRRRKFLSATLRDFVARERAGGPTVESPPGESVENE